VAGDTIALVEHLFRRQAGRMVARLTRTLGSQHLGLAEDAVQDALITALQQWPFRGVPEQPEAWLYLVAKNRALDRLRHVTMASEKESEIAQESPSFQRPSVEAMLRDELPPVDDDQLGMLFLTCHPAVAAEARVALALKLVGGFSVGEIARAFLAPETTIAQRLVRAKRILREHDVDFGMPAPADLASRLDSVLESLYLMFNEGYAATMGDALVRDEVAGEAIRLASLVAAHPATDSPKGWALLALMLLHAARFPARVDSHGTMFLLRDQDRSTWDRHAIAAGLRALDRAASGDRLSAFHLEAGLAACHAVAPSWAATDWPQIVRIYDELLALTASPVVAMNRAIAVSRLEGPLAGLAVLAAIAGRSALERYPLLPAVEAELWREAGEADRAAACYRRALALVRSGPEQRWLSSRLTHLV
jgi:RNA polymerase sigma-70 factor (ECF subfamily)